MNDYIERQAAIDELNGQIEYCNKALESFDISLKDEYAVKVERALLIAYKEQLETIPAADVAPVIRCKECKYFMSPHACSHDDGMITAQSNGFCSYGERKE